MTAGNGHVSNGGTEGMVLGLLFANDGGLTASAIVTELQGPEPFDSNDWGFVIDGLLHSLDERGTVTYLYDAESDENIYVLTGAARRQFSAV